MYILRFRYGYVLSKGTQGKWSRINTFKTLFERSFLSCSSINMVSRMMPNLYQRFDPEGSYNAFLTGALNVGWQSGVNEKALISGRTIIGDWKRRLQSSPYRGTAVFVLGAMGSGKSTAIEKEFKQHLEFKHYAYVDTDGFMEMLDGFTPEKVEQYYPIAREIAIYLTDWLLTENISFVAEGTCVKFLELEDYMERLKETGYSIKVRRIDSPPLDTVLMRSRRRKNRQLSDDLVRSIYYGSRHGIEQLFKLNSNTNLFMEI